MKQSNLLPSYEVPWTSEKGPHLSGTTPFFWGGIGVTHPKTDMTMEHPPFEVEDVSMHLLLNIAGVFQFHVSFQGYKS